MWAGFPFSGERSPRFFIYIDLEIFLLGIILAVVFYRNVIVKSKERCFQNEKRKNFIFSTCP